MLPRGAAGRDGLAGRRRSDRASRRARCDTPRRLGGLVAEQVLEALPPLLEPDEREARASATASRTRSYGRSSSQRDEDASARRAASQPGRDERRGERPPRPPRPRRRATPGPLGEGARAAPHAASRPASIATRKSQTRSISPSRWLATMTAIPNSVPVRRTSASISSRPAGSRPLVGSSRSSSRGSWTSAWASLTRCFMPVE